MSFSNEMPIGSPPSRDSLAELSSITTSSKPNLPPTAPLKKTSSETLKKVASVIANTAPPKTMLSAIGNFLTMSVTGMALDEVRKNLATNPITLSGEGVIRAGALVLGSALIALSRLIGFCVGATFSLGASALGMVLIIGLFHPKTIENVLNFGTALGVLVGGIGAILGGNVVDYALQNSEERGLFKKDKMILTYAAIGAGIGTIPAVFGSIIGHVIAVFVDDEQRVKEKNEAFKNLREGNLGVMFMSDEEAQDWSKFN